MAAVVIVGVEPGGEGCTSFGVAAVEPGVGPLIGQSLVEAFDLPLVRGR